MLLEGLKKPVDEGYPTNTAMFTLGRNGWFSAGQKDYKTKAKRTKSNPKIRNHKAKTREKGTEDKISLSIQRNPHLG